MAKRIVIMAGGTGGHVYPALAVAETLVSQGWHVSWLGTRKGLESKIVPAKGLEIDWLSVAGLRGKGLKTKVKSVFLMIKACFEAWKILKTRQPDVVLGMGGFVAAPGGLMAKFLQIPIVIHEQNRIPGTTNRLFAKMANQVLEAFPGSFSQDIGAVFTGNPVRKEILSLFEKNLKHDSIVNKILVIGGSLGAKALNQSVPEAVALLKNVQIKHQTGERMHAQVKDCYQALGIDAEVVAYIEDMKEAYEWADIAVCRAGAMTVSELAIAGLPAVLIPYPYAIDDHQTANANYLVEAGAAVILQEKNLTPKHLAEELEKLINNRENMSQAARKCAVIDATKTVSECCKAEAQP